MNEIIIIGYSGHSYVVIDAILKNNHLLKGYCDQSEKRDNPFDLQYLGKERNSVLENNDWIISIGSNTVRKSIYVQYHDLGNLISVVHKSAVVGYSCDIRKGTFVAAKAIINPFTSVGVCCIINTGAIVEHECSIGDFTHIAPGAVLAGNVTLGDSCFIGANATIKQGVSIGDNVTVGAGCVVINDVKEGVTLVGNPGRILGS